MSSCIVVGGGFKGIIAAYLLREKGFEVTLVEKSKHLGGIMYSSVWEGFNIDNGVHLFDSIPKNLGLIIEEVMDGDVYPINFNYASVYNDITTDGLAIPDFENLGESEKQKILYELIQLIASDVDYSDSQETALARMQRLYGNTAANLMNASMEHIYGVSANKVEADSLRQTAYHRIKFLPDAMALELKKHPVLDQRIAAKRVVIGKVDDYVSLYPGAGGMRTFCDRIKGQLVKMGVDIKLGEGVRAVNYEFNGVPSVELTDGCVLQSDTLFWGFDHSVLANTWKNDCRLSDKIFGSPMVVFYFQVMADKINDYTYFHQFTPKRYVFRAAAAGLYSQQINSKGVSFISVECPAKMDSDFWEQPEKYTNEVWTECVSMGLIKPGTSYLGTPNIKKAAVTHRFPLRGQFELCDELETDINDRGGKIIVCRKEAFTRREIMIAVENAIKEMTR